MKFKNQFKYMFKCQRNLSKSHNEYIKVLLNHKNNQKDTFSTISKSGFSPRKLIIQGIKFPIASFLRKS